MKTLHSTISARISCRGYTLLFAVITAALVLGVAVFILSVSKKQYALSVAARDSMYALYAADSGMECAIATGLATSSAMISCNSSTPVPLAFAGPQSLNTSTWPNAVVYAASNVVLDLPDNTCALVTIYDGYYVDPADGFTKHKTIIESRGYNFCDAGVGPKESSRTVERALRLTYR